MIKNLAIIPARGGSKRIPGKNIKPFLGKPIIAYSIQAALASGVFDEVMVSTDDKHIAAIAEQYGAKVPFMRSNATANDYAGLAEVLIEVLNEYEKRGNLPENFCCLLPTAPLLSQEEICTAFNVFYDGAYDSLYPIVRFSYPVQRAVVVNDQGCAEMRWPEYYSSRSQDLEPMYHDSGTFYWMRSKKMSQYGKLITPKTGVIEMDEIKVQDIDTEMDRQLAELKFQLLYNGK